MTFAFRGPWNVGRLAPELPMSFRLTPWGDFTALPLAGPKACYRRSPKVKWW